MCLFSAFVVFRAAKINGTETMKHSSPLASLHHHFSQHTNSSLCPVSVPAPLNTQCLYFGCFGVFFLPFSLNFLFFFCTFIPTSSIHTKSDSVSPSQSTGETGTGKKSPVMRATDSLHKLVRYYTIIFMHTWIPMQTDGK